MGIDFTKIKSLTNSGDTGLFTDGDWVESKDQDPDGGIRLIQLADVGINKFKNKSNRFLTESKADELKCTFLKKGDLLISRLPDPLGRTCMFPFDGENKYVTVVDVSILRVNQDSYDSKYVEYILNAPQTRQEVQNKQTGTTRKRISRKNLAEIEIPTPSLPTQHRIVEKIEELFSELDNGVENLKKAQKQLKTYRQAVLKDAFEGKLTKEWREQQTDLPTHEELLQQIKAERKAHRQRELAEWENEVEQWDKDGEPSRKPRKPSKPKKLPEITEEDLNSLPEIPVTWRYTYLNDLGDLGRGKSKHRPRNDEKLFKGGTIPFIQTGEVKAAAKYLRTFEDTYNEFGLSQSKLWPAGTLCITIAANIAETAILDIDACFPDSIVGYTSYESIADKLFLFYFIQSVQKRLEAFAPATAQKNINLTTLENLLVPLCSLEEQKEIVNEIESRLSVVDQLEQTIKENLQKAEALRQSILKKAFGGGLR
ncbi:MAG: restriction endonuclease subunit S [Candidatus Paceibacterota bacterium]